MYFSESLEDYDSDEYLYPYHVPVMTENLVNLDFLWTHGLASRHKNDIYCLAAEKGRLKVLEYIFDQVEDKNPKAHEGLTLLHCAGA